MALRGLGMMTSLFMIAGFVLLGGFPMLSCCLFVVIRSGTVVLRALIFMGCHCRFLRGAFPHPETLSGLPCSVGMCGLFLGSASPKICNFGQGMGL